MSQRLKSFRAYLGGVALALGVIGLLLFSIGIPLTLFTTHFWAGMGFREGPQPTPEQLAAVINRDLWWCVLHWLGPLFILSLALISYGFYEAHQERVNKP